jgi:hypothetical protein
MEGSRGRALTRLVAGDTPIATGAEVGVGVGVGTRDGRKRGYEKEETTSFVWGEGV